MVYGWTMARFLGYNNQIIDYDVDFSIQTVNEASSYLERAFSLIADDQSNLETQKLIDEIADGFLDIAKYYYILDSAYDAKRMVERACKIGSCSSLFSKDHWVKLITVAMDKGLQDDVYLYNQKILQLHFPPSEWMRLIKLAWEKGFYDVVISYIKKALPVDFPASGLERNGFSVKDRNDIYIYYIFASRRIVPTIDIDLYNKFLAYEKGWIWPIILEFGKFYGHNLDFDVAELWLDSGRFNAEYDYHEEYIGPQIFQRGDFWKTIKENTPDNNGYGYLGLAEMAKQNDRRDLCKKYIKIAEKLLNNYRKSCSDYDKNFVAEIQRQIKILKH